MSESDSDLDWDEIIRRPTKGIFTSMNIFGEVCFV